MHFHEIKIDFSYCTIPKGYTIYIINKTAEHVEVFFLAATDFGKMNNTMLKMGGNKVLTHNGHSPLQEKY